MEKLIKFATDEAQLLTHQYKWYAQNHDNGSSMSDYMYGRFLYACDEYLTKAQQRIGEIVNAPITEPIVCEHYLYKCQNVVNKLSNELLCAINEIWIGVPIIIEDQKPNEQANKWSIESNLRIKIDVQVECANRYIRETADKRQSYKKQLKTQFGKLDWYLESALISPVVYQQTAKLMDAHLASIREVNKIFLLIISSVLMLADYSSKRESTKFGDYN